MTWYKTGTVQVTSGSNAVVGTGTAFIANARVGDAFSGPDGNWYEVINIVSDTSLGIYPNYRSASVASGGVYIIAPMEGYVKDSADALRAATQIIGQAGADVSAQVTLATNAASSATNAATSATNAATSATSSASSAITSASNAAASATSANSSKVAAKASEDATKLSETNAATSATAAANSAASVANKASSGANSDITSLSGLTTPLSVAQGGTGGNSQATAQTALGLVKVTSNTDATSGRVVTPGWMGLGGVALPINSGDFDTFGNTSMFVVANNCTHAPIAGSLYVIHLVATANQYIYQRATDVTTGKTYDRQMKLGTWDTVWKASNTWGSISGTLSAQTDLQAALNAKLSVAEVGGTDLNGWRKYSDGTIEQWGMVSVPNTPAGILFSFNTPFLSIVQYFNAAPMSVGRSTLAEANSGALATSLSEFRISSGFAVSPLNYKWYARGK